MSKENKKNDRLQTAQFIKKERLKRGWTQAQLAEISSLSERTIQRAERNGILSLETRKALASAFDINVDQFLTQKDPSSIDEPQVHFLTRLRTGQEIINNLGKREMYQNNYDELREESEVDLIGSFFQTIVDLGDIWDDLDQASRVRFDFELNNNLSELEEFGFWLFGSKREVTFTVGTTMGVKKELPMEVSLFFIKRKDCPQIIHAIPGNEHFPIILPSDEKAPINIGY